MAYTGKQIKGILRQGGYKLTPQRCAILDAISHSNEHLTPAEIHDRIRQDNPHVGLVTVYRTLELLVELGLVRETHLGPGRRFFEVEEEVPHHHLVCEECGAVVHVHGEDLPGLGTAIHGRTGFTLREVTVFGTCRGCKATKEEA